MLKALNSFERWMFKRAVRKIVRQDYNHPQKITALFAEIVQAARDEFTEDNEATRRAYLTEWFQDALEPPYMKRVTANSLKRVPLRH